MKSILFGTTNEAKIKQVRGALLPAGITVVGVIDKSLLPEVVEDGKTAIENARKKSLTYAKALGKTVFSMDNALYLDGLSPEEQPALNVRRIKGTTNRPTDQEMVEYYSKLVGKLGGEVNGYWEFGICIANPQGEHKVTIIKSHRTFVDKPSNIINEGYPLASIQIDPDSGRYFSEMSQEELDTLWQNTIGKPLLAFVKSVDL